MAERTPWSLSGALRGVFAKKTIDADTWDDLEDSLIQADFGPDITDAIVAELRAKVSRYNTTDPKDLHRMLREGIEERLAKLDSTLNLSARPAVVLVVGVNGVGKTTTIGKFAKFLRVHDRSVLIGAADTFRAAAVDQLATWGDRVGVEVVRGPEGSDPASVAFEAVKQGVDQGVDTVLVDTAGRLQNKAGLMDELGKIKRVIEKQADVTEVLLVLDATTGQNGLIQARVFSEIVDVTGIVLTKLDGSAKGGIVIQVQRELGVPVKLVGLGEGADDLAPFDPGAFVDALLG